MAWGPATGSVVQGREHWLAALTTFMSANGKSDKAFPLTVSLESQYNDGIILPVRKRRLREMK